MNERDDETLTEAHSRMMRANQPDGTIDAVTITTAGLLLEALDRIKALEDSICRRSSPFPPGVACALVPHFYKNGVCVACGSEADCSEQPDGWKL